MVRAAMKLSPDYQQFILTADGSFEEIGARMQKKLAALPDLDLRGKSVLDIGCDYGFWSFRAAHRGAARVLGLDRGRDVHGVGAVDLPAQNRQIAASHARLAACSFENINLGRQWLEFGRFDVAYMFSMYHHVYQAADGDHVPVWYWLHRHLKPDGVLVWENPLVAHDSTVARHVSAAHHANYNAAAILAAAERYFEPEYFGPARHSPTREVYLFHPKSIAPRTFAARPVDGVKGASRAMLYHDGARIGEVEQILGFRPFPGSLNLRYDGAPDLTQGYYRATLMDMPRGDIAGQWAPRMARFYPLAIDGRPAWAVHFEDQQKHRAGLTECYAPERLRDVVGEQVTLTW
jgi:2-polyprenyl-3-methyl-5-hydroxy-6-metoxy-1,4-benzoquinol methylase